MKKKDKYKIWIVVILLSILAIFVISEIFFKAQVGTTKITKEVYCNAESRNVNVCVEIYSPVCGWFDSKKIQCIKYPCAQTFSNGCFACQDEKVEYYTEGECPV
ncbi:MAG: hypothetical protein AABW51_05100 [Nanoarchaeota archaeon]